MSSFWSFRVYSCTVLFNDLLVGVSSVAFNDLIKPSLVYSFISRVISCFQRVSFSELIHRLISKSSRYQGGTFYISDLHEMQSRSTTLDLLDLPRSHSTNSDRAFSVQGKKLWNSLPADIRNSTSINRFKRFALQ